MDNSDLSTDLYSLVQSTYNLPVMSTLELVRTAGQSLVDCLQCAEDQSDSDSFSSRGSSEGCVGDKNGVLRAYKGIYCMYCTVCQILFTSTQFIYIRYMYKFRYFHSFIYSVCIHIYIYILLTTIFVLIFYYRKNKEINKY